MMTTHSMPRPTRRRFLQSTLFCPVPLSALGRPAGAQIVPAAQQESLINTTTSGLQHRPAVVGVAQAEAFVAIWVDRFDATIKGRSFSAAEDRSGAEFTVNSSTERNTVRE